MLMFNWHIKVCKMDMGTLTLARYILETSLMFYEFVPVSESLMAAACFLMALRMKSLGDWVGRNLPACFYCVLKGSPS